MGTAEVNGLTGVAARVAAPPQVPPVAEVHHRRRWWLLGAMVVLAAGAAAWAWKSGRSTVAYETALVARGDLESTVVAAGVLQPFQYVDVGAQTSGKLKVLKVARGDQVKKGDLLAIIDPALANTVLTAARATLANMTAQHAVRKAQLVLAALQRDRAHELFLQRQLPAADHDIALAAHDVALAEVASLAAQMRQAAATVDAARANLGYTNITAPMDGEVVSITTLEGQTLNANQLAPNILRIADLRVMTVWTQVSEADISSVKPGQDVYFTVLGQPRRWRGTVRQVLPTPELINNVVFYDALFDVTNDARDLHIQMTAQVFIVLAQVKGALLLPLAAVGNAPAGAAVNAQVLNSDGKPETRAVRIGIRSEVSAEVTQGLVEQERVVLGNALEPSKARSKSALSARSPR
jgi:macrolide-specific efflux system membrane fusion protein